MIDTLLNQAAMAIYRDWPRRDDAGHPVPWIALTMHEREPFIVSAQRVLEAIAEPSDETVEAGFKAWPIPPMRAAKNHYRAAYKSMISHIWSGKP